jgi:predicted nucleotidyltransferase
LHSAAQIQLVYDPEKLREFCHRWQVAELGLFGSVLTERFRPESDIDVLVTFLPEARPTLLDLARMEAELSEIFGQPVDLVEKQALMQSRNPIRRQAILSSVEVLYAHR